MPTEYQLVFATSKHIFEEQVEEALAEGWQMQGDLQVAVSSVVQYTSASGLPNQENELLYIQAFTRVAEDKDVAF